MDDNRCTSLNEFLYKPGFQNLVQGVHALNTARKSFCDLIEQQWNHFIAGLPDTENEQLGSFIRCLNLYGMKLDCSSTRKENLGCGHATCELLYTRLRKLSYVTGDISAEQDVEGSLQEKRHDLSYSGDGFNLIWDLANCFIGVTTQDVKLHDPKLNAKTLIELMKNCRMFAFKDSDRIYSQILEDIDKLIYARELLISKEGLDVLTDHLLVLLSHWKNNCQSCSYGFDDIKKMQHDYADCENFEYKLLVKNVLEIIKGMLNDNESDSDLPTNISSTDVSSSKELISSLLSQVEEMISILEPNELLELKQKIESLEAENKILQMEIVGEKSKGEAKMKENRELQDKMRQLEAERERQKTLSTQAQNELSDSKQENERLKKDNVNFKTEIEKMRSSRDEEISKNKELQLKLKNLETDLEKQKYGRDFEIKGNRELQEKVSLLERHRCLERLTLHNLRKLRYNHHNLSSLRERLSSSRLQVVSFGSFQDVVLKIDGLTVLFDPFDTEVMADKYLRELNWSIIDKNPNFEVDVVALSMCAYSFSDLLVRKVVQRNRNVKWIVPLERKDWLIRQGVDSTSITLFKFWDEKIFNIRHQNVSFVCTPTHRNSVSSGSKMCNTCGWIVKGLTRTFYSAGFTNYNETNFSRVTQRHGPIHLALLPISNTSGNMSCSPEFSVEIDEILEMHKKLQSCTSLGIETWDYWYRSSENIREKLKKKMQTLNLDPQRFHFLDVNEPYESDQS